MSDASPRQELEQAAAAALQGEIELLEVIGSGATAMVFCGRRIADGARVAVKVLRPDVASGIEGERFLREIAIETRLVHPGIVPVISWGRKKGLVYAVMAWDGDRTLRDHLDHEGQLGVEEAVRITRAIAEALGYAHDNGIVHRDVKPENVLVSGDRVRLLDFGIARALIQAVGERITHSGVAVGTPAYMSPEQAAGNRHIDARSDQYSLACVLFEMLTGDPPFSGRSAQAIIARHLGEAAPSARVVRSTIPASVDAVLQRALSKSAADRYPTIAAFSEALAYAQTPEGRAAAGRGTRRRIWVSTLVVVSVITAIAMVMWPTPRTLDENKVVIYPLADARPEGESDAGWSAAIAIESSLEHALPLRGLDGWTVLPAKMRADPRALGVSDAARRARQVGARYLITGAIARLGDSLSVVLRLYDAAADSLVAQESALGDARTVVAPQLGIRATRALLPRLLAPGRVVDISMLEGRDPSAIALWLNGERAYRRSDFVLSLDMLERAVAEDSALAVAAIRGAQAASWETDLARATGLLRVASAQAARLPAKYLPFIAGLQAYLRGDADSARNALRAATAREPAWLEPRMALGEVYYHLSPSDGATDSTALALFESVAAADTGFAPPLLHLAEEAVRAGNLRRADALLAQMTHLNPRARLPRRLSMMRECVANPQEVPWTSWAAESTWAALYAGRLLAVGGAQVPCAKAAFRAVLGVRDVPAGLSWGALLELQGLLVSERRFVELRALLDSAVAAGNSKARLLYVLDEVAGAPTAEQGAATVAFGRQLYGETYATSRPETRWVLALWHAARGDVAMVEVIAASLDSLVRATGGREERLISAAVAAHLALARKDTALAVSRLRGLRATASRDSLQWDLFEPLAVERIVLARLLVARGEHAEAYNVARTFDQPESVMNLMFLAESLRIREHAARALGRRSAAIEAERRLKQLERLK